MPPVQTRKPAKLVVGGALLAGAAALGLLRRPGTPALRGPRSIATLEKVSLGGSDQWILERSEDTANPVILFLHGGPGTSQLTLNRRMTRNLEKHFTVVNWDQRGAGKSYGAIAPAEKMNISQFVEDTRELTQYLLQKFGQSRVILVGHSWGSVVGLIAASRYPDLYHCYVGIGQVANAAEGEAESYRWTMEQAHAANNLRAVKALETIGPPPYSGDWRRKTVTRRGQLARFGGEVHGSSKGAFKFILPALLFSREYNLRDRINFFRGIFGSMKLLWPELQTVDLFTSVPELMIPVFFVEGRFDREAPSTIAARYFEHLHAPAKELHWFENSAHMPNWEEPAEFTAFMVKRVLPTAL